MKTKNILALTVSAIVAASFVATAGAEGGKDRKGPRHHMAKQLKELDLNNDGKLSEEEMIAGKTALFQKMDANQDGSLTQAEIKSFKDAEKERRKKEREDKHFAKLDADGDGSATLDEFLAPTSTRFDCMDTNGDGFLSKDDRKGKAKGDRKKGERKGERGKCMTGPEADDMPPAPAE